MAEGGAMFYDCKKNDHAPSQMLRKRLNLALNV